MPFLGIGILISLFIIYYGIAHEPLIDFRDYKIGTDLNLEKQKSRLILQNTKLLTLKNTKTGEEKMVGQDEFVNQKRILGRRNTLANSERKRSFCFGETKLSIFYR